MPSVGQGYFCYWNFSLWPPEPGLESQRGGDHPHCLLSNLITLLAVLCTCAIDSNSLKHRRIASLFCLLSNRALSHALKDCKTPECTSGIVNTWDQKKKLPPRRLTTARVSWSSVIMTLISFFPITLEATHQLYIENVKAGFPALHSSWRCIVNAVKLVAKFEFAFNQTDL